MSELIPAIKKLFPTGVYGPSCTEEEIVEAEQILGTRLPLDLRTIYLHFNGLQLSGSPSKLFALLPRHANTSLVSIILFWRTGPGAVENIIFYGMFEKQYYLGTSLTPPPAIVEYNYDLDHPQVVSKTIVEAYIKDEEWVNSLSRNAK